VRVIIKYIISKKETIFEILFCFLACGIFGWLYETVFVLIQTGAMTDRGILFISTIGSFPIIWGLPFILIYGIGGAVLIWGFKPLANKPVLLFIIGLVSMTVFEYLTALFCETVLHQKLWDYSDKFMNLQGRISLFTSLMWGLLSLLAVLVFGPVFHKLYSKIKHKHIMHIVLIVLVMLVFVCYILRPGLFPDMV